MIVQPQDFREILFNEMQTDDDELTVILDLAMDSPELQEKIHNGYTIYFSACPDDDTVAVFGIKDNSPGAILLEDEETYYTIAEDYIKAYLAH